MAKAVIKLDFVCYVLFVCREKNASFNSFILKGYSGCKMSTFLR